MEKVSKLFSFFGFFISLASLFLPAAMLGFSAYSNATQKLGVTMSLLYFVISIASVIFAILAKKFARKVKSYHFKRFVMLIASIALLVNSFIACFSIIKSYTGLSDKITLYISVGISVVLVALCITFYVISGKNNRAPKGMKPKKKAKKKKKVVNEPAYERDLLYR